MYKSPTFGTLAARLNNLTSPAGPGDDDLYDRVADAIEDPGYIILPMALPMALTDGLYHHLRALDTGDFKPARIGRELDEIRNPFVRNDRIRWLDPKVQVVADYLAWAEGLRLAMNRRLFLGLFDYECHFLRMPLCLLSARGVLQAPSGRLPGPAQPGAHHRQLFQSRLAAG